MTYDQFVQEVKEKVKKEVDEDVSVQIHRSVKNNGTVRKGLLLTQSEVNISPTIYLEEFYEQFIQNKSIERIVEDVLQLYGGVRFETPFDGKSIRDYEQMKSKLIYHLINREKNAEMLTEVPYMPYLDMAIICCVLLEVNEFGTATMMVQQEHLKYWDVEFSTVYKQAHKNTAVSLPYEFQTIGAAIAELADVEDDKMEENMYVLSNHIRSFGATTILYQNRLQEIGRYLQEDFYILPSSVHEVIVVTKGEAPTHEVLRDMVVEINATQLKEEEVLSDNVYYYNCEKGILTVV